MSTCHGVCMNAYNNVDTRESVSDRPCQSRGSSSARCQFMAHSGVIDRQPALVSEELSERVGERVIGEARCTQEGSREDWCACA